MLHPDNQNYVREVNTSQIAFSFGERYSTCHQEFYFKIQMTNFQIIHSFNIHFLTSYCVQVNAPDVAHWLTLSIHYASSGDRIRFSNKNKGNQHMTVVILIILT